MYKPVNCLFESHDIQFYVNLNYRLTSICTFVVYTYGTLECLVDVTLYNCVSLLQARQLHLQIFPRPVFLV
jgi:hypothetical protein